MIDIYLFDNVSVVVDNNVLVDPYEINCLKLLFDCFDEVIIPKIIYDSEILDVVLKELAKYEVTVGNIETEIGLETYAFLVTDVKYKRLSKCDCFAIAIAKENLYYCNSNDKPVREACLDLSVKYTGVLGVLGRALMKGSISDEQLDLYIDKLLSDETSCYISEKVINKFREEIDRIKAR